jgi:hypothetical protein
MMRVQLGILVRHGRVNNQLVYDFNMGGINKYHGCRVASSGTAASAHAVAVDTALIDQALSLVSG